MIEPMTNWTELIRSFPWVDGDIAEFGCFNGGSCRDLAKLGRTTWAFDTFDGIPAEDYDQKLDYQNPPGSFKPGHDVVAYLSTIPNVIIKKGRYINTLPSIPAGTIFAIVYLDCDYYASYKQVLEYLEEHDHIVPGTIIVCDDYPHLVGSKMAVDEWRKHRPITHDQRVIIYDGK